MDFVYTFLLLAFFSFISFIVPYFYSKKRISKLKKEIAELNEPKYMKIQGKIIDFEEHYYVKKGQACDYYYFPIVSCNYLGEDYILKVNMAIQSYSFREQSKSHKDQLPLFIGDNIKIECKFDDFSAFVALSKSIKEKVSFVIRYIGFGKLAKQKGLYKNCNAKIWYLFMYPLGVAYYLKKKKLAKQEKL